jgi:carboxypeptidase T
MGRRRTTWTLAGALAAAALLLGPQITDASAAQTPTPAAPTGLAVYRVPATTDAAAQRLLNAGFDVLEKRSGGDLFVLGDAATAGKLRAAGFTATVDAALAPAGGTAPTTRLVPDAKALADPITETYDGGYHTVKAQYAHLDATAAAYPALTRVVDYGDSYLKTRNAATGYDLKTICITHKTADYDCKLYPGAPRPRFVLMSQMHAREIVGGDISWRFIDYLTQNYGKKADVTSLLDSTEIWVIPVDNPDGVDLVQQGGNNPYLQRKNADGSGCGSPPGGDQQIGVDLNRNTANHWGTTGGVGDRCSQIYPGPNGDSEAETKAVQTLFKQLYPDQRGPNDTDAAPVTAKGTMLSIHSYAGMVLFPWGYQNVKAPNDTGLRAIASNLAQTLGYDYGRPGEVLYTASGNIEDWTYGTLGVASFAIEADSCDSFTPAYSCAGSQFTKFLPALMKLGQKAKAPYKP